jgi:hypothetical protein
LILRHVLLRSGVILFSFQNHREHPEVGRPTTLRKCSVSGRAEAAQRSTPKTPSMAARNAFAPSMANRYLLSVGRP